MPYHNKQRSYSICKLTGVDLRKLRCKVCNTKCAVKNSRARTTFASEVVLVLLCRKTGPGFSCSVPGCAPVRPKPQVGTLRSGAILQNALTTLWPCGVWRVARVELQLKMRIAWRSGVTALFCATPLRVRSERRITHMQRINSWRATPVSGAMVLAPRQSCHTCGTAAFSLTRRPSCAAALRPEVNSMPPTSGLAGAAMRPCVVLACNSCCGASACPVSVRSKLSPWPMLPWGKPGSTASAPPLVAVVPLGLVFLRFFLFFWQRHHIGMRRWLPGPRCWPNDGIFLLAPKILLAFGTTSCGQSKTCGLRAAY